MASTEREPIMEVWGRAPIGVQGTAPIGVQDTTPEQGVRGAKPPKLKALFSFRSVHKQRANLSIFVIV